MAQKKFNIPKAEIPNFKLQVYTYANSFSTCLCLDSNATEAACGYDEYDFVVGIGTKATLKVEQTGNAFEQLKNFHAVHNGWLLGYLGYDLKNEVEKLQSNNPDGLGFPAMYFFVPEVLIRLKENSIFIDAQQPAEIFEAIQATSLSTQKEKKTFSFIPRVSKEKYLEKIHQTLNHIEEGDVYEMNVCMEYFAENVKIDPLHTYIDLQKISPVPFAAYAKFEDELFALCSSPERFMKKTGAKLISQPIKGTAKRGKDKNDDDAMKQHLFSSEKEMAENVMIVDLVRNDLARSCKTGTIKVEELFGIYSFPQVHQMISTITGTLRNDVHWADAIKNAFPMGSMTGAPKVKAMELIEKYEESRRGLFSGAIGYITPEGDFDFNVVIRSLLYQYTTQYLSYHVGGAITYDSVPEEEYNECILKASAIEQVGKGKI